MRAVIDIGSNSVRMLYACAGVYRKVGRITQLARGTQGGLLAPDAMRRTLGVAARYGAWARRRGDALSVYATSAVRDAANRPAFERAARALTGVRLDVLTGEEEARIAFAACCNHRQERLCAIDIGGRSTELALGEGGVLLHCLSRPIGAVNLTASGQSTKEMIAQATSAFIKEAHAYGEARTFALIGGTATTLAALDQALAVYEDGKVDGYALDRHSVGHWLDRLASMPLQEREALSGMQAGRSGTIVAGCCILMGVLKALGCARAIVSARDGLEGYLEGEAIRLDKKGENSVFW